MRYVRVKETSVRDNFTRECSTNRHLLKEIWLDIKLSSKRALIRSRKAVRDL